MSRTILAWHFTDGMKYRDGSPLVVGRPCPHIENISICNRGYHASEDILHALEYAPGLYLSRTEHSGNIERQEDKLCSQDRTPLWAIDFTSVMIEFVKACAASAKISADQAASYAASYASDAASYASDAASYAASYASDAASYAASYARSAASYASYASYARSAASYARYAASYARYAASYASDAASYAEKEWQSVVLLQLVSNEYDRLCEAL